MATEKKPRICPACERRGTLSHAYTSTGPRVVCVACRQVFYLKHPRRNGPVYRSSDLDNSGERTVERVQLAVSPVDSSEHRIPAPKWTVYAGENGSVRIVADGYFTEAESNLLARAIVEKTRDVKHANKKARGLLRYAFYEDGGRRYVEWVERISARVELVRIRPRSEVSCRKCGVQKSAAWFRPVSDLFDDRFAWRSARFCDTCVRCVEGKAPFRDLRLVAE